MKSIIVKGRNSNNVTKNRSNSNKSNNPSYKTVKPHSCNEKPFTKANLNEILNELIVESNESQDASNVAKNVIDNNESTLLVNSTTAIKHNPGDIRKLLTIPIKGSPLLYPSSTKKIACKKESNDNGKSIQKLESMSSVNYPK